MTGATARPLPRPPDPDLSLAGRLFDELRQRTAAMRGVTRMSYGLGEQIAHDIIRREARRLGLDVRIDAAANMFVTLRGETDGPATMIGSHLDSVPLGGNYDGSAGVLLGLAVLAGFKATGTRPSCDLVLMVIRAEESAWFGASYIGSRAAFGRLSADELRSVRRAGDGLSLQDAIAAAGGDPAALASGTRSLDPGRIGVFLEAHIEQGPVLRARQLPIGLVTGIRGSVRHREARCLGAYAHSGATPRADRQDAVSAVARLIVQMDDLWAHLSDEGHDLTVTFGQINTDAEEASFSKVAGDVRFSLDLRSASERTLAEAKDALDAAVSRIERFCNVRFELGATSSSTAVTMDPGVLAGLSTAARDLGIGPLEMPCGAGHDAAVFADVGVPTGMIFIRNENGSHNPDEHMEMADFADAARLVARFCAAPQTARA